MPPAKSGTRLRWAWPLLLVLVIAFLAVARLDFAADRPESALAPDSTADEAPEMPGFAPPSEPAHPRAPQPAPTQAASSQSRTRAAPALCPGYARKACHQGDVWWFDACGQATERVEACDGRACLGLGCAPASWPDDACGDVSGVGRCRGTVATACLAGRLVSHDCAASGERCAITSEGARCLPHTREDCASGEPASCDGDALVRCVDGRRERLDCARRLGRCAVSNGQAQCVGTQAPDGASEPAERCNGADDDLDGASDEGGVCDAIPLVAFVAGGRVPEGFTATLQRELATLQRVFHPLTFAWRTAVPDAAPERLDPELLRGLAERLSRSGADAAFFIPVLFVEAIATRPPTSGQSSLPNWSCGGVRISDRLGLPDGLVVVSEARTPETLAHEIGHYLGLCHTHDEITAYGLATQAAECEQSGDAICDTPLDPGPERCALKPGCDVTCAQGAARPDVSNVMSYYMPCRRGLSADQLAVVERGLALRRGWFRCLDARQCPCALGDPQVCPAQMSCRAESEQGQGACELDGPALPGAPCQNQAECSGGAVCLGTGAGAARASRCVRACKTSSEGCTCSDAGLSFRLCAEDVR